MQRRPGEKILPSEGKLCGYTRHEKSRPSPKKIENVLQESTNTSMNLLDLSGISSGPSIMSTPRHIRRHSEDDWTSEDSSEAEELSFSEETTDCSSTAENEKENNVKENEALPTLEKSNGARIEWHVELSNEIPNLPFLMEMRNEFCLPKSMEYFKQYFSKTFLGEICNLSNSYAVLKNPNTTFVSPRSFCNIIWESTFT